jgi:hypothetical protein
MRRVCKRRERKDCEEEEKNKDEKVLGMYGMS